MATTAKITLILVCLLLSQLAVAIPTSADHEELPPWNDNWNYHQEITLPINTNQSNAHYQPIDLEITFEQTCWTKSENHTSIRILCLHNNQWHELESQIYNLRYTSEHIIQQCGIVFLIPTLADGTERYFIFYHNQETPPTNYPDHVAVSDQYYNYSPFKEITAEAHYYSITQDGKIVYGVGQEGQLLDRAFAQIIIKQQPNMEQFDVLNSDQTVSFAFSYYYGNNEEDESSSDQVFLAKKIWTDGNLMVEFGIISESARGDIRTTGIYKYYYTPTEERRLSANIKHEFMDTTTVSGITNIDGRYGTIVSIRSRNPRVQQMNSGTIFPYIHFPDEDNNLIEYQMNLDPETRAREWIIDYKDDADIGPQAWLAYGEGLTGKTRGIIFHSNQNILKSGTDERDGIQIKAAEKEYFNFLGTEVDYASINFGRNSYEPGSPHDLIIPKNFIVQFDAEIYANDQDGYPAVQQEARLFQQLIKHRTHTQSNQIQEPPATHNLKVITHLGGTHLTYPRLARHLKIPVPTMEIELYQNNQRIRTLTANRSANTRSHTTFHNLPEGIYLIKVYYQLTDNLRFYHGAALVRLFKNQEYHILCTWQRKTTLTLTDQHQNPLTNITVNLIGSENQIYDTSKTNQKGTAILHYPYSRSNTYYLQSLYKNQIIHQTQLPTQILSRKLTATIPFHNITLILRDTTDQPPGIPLTPLLIPQNSKTTTYTPTETNTGTYQYHHIPQGTYTITVSYGQNEDTQILVLNQDTQVLFPFTPTYTLITQLHDNRGNDIDASNYNLIITRGSLQKTINAKTTPTLPPGSYSLTVNKENTIIGQKNLELLDDKTITLLTSETPQLPTLITIALTIFSLLIILLYLTKKISLPYLLITLFTILLLLSLYQPWWQLTGTAPNQIITKTSTMYITPLNMIDSITTSSTTSYEQADLPDLFIDTLTILPTIILLTLITLFGVTFVHYIKKPKYELLLTIITLILPIILLMIFYTAMSVLCDVSIGPVIGNGTTTATINSQEYQLSSSWGFSSGYYLIIAAILPGISILILTLKNHFFTHSKLLKKQN